MISKPEYFEQLGALRATMQDLPGIEGDRDRKYTSGQSITLFTEPKEIADLCLFLSSPAAGMISGQAIAIDGHTGTYRI